MCLASPHSTPCTEKSSGLVNSWRGVLSKHNFNYVVVSLMFTQYVVLSLSEFLWRVLLGCFLAFPGLAQDPAFSGLLSQLPLIHLLPGFQRFVAVVSSPILFVLVGLWLLKKSPHCCFSEVLGGNESQCGYSILHLYSEPLYISVSFLLPCNR